MTTVQTFLWVAFPTSAIVAFVVGQFWRYRYDKFGWTTRSSQVYESKLLRWGSPMFHLGILMVIAGHVVGLLIPREWLYAIGISEEMYHVAAVGFGVIAAVMVVTGLSILIYRRRTVGRVFLATTVMDKVMYVFLGAVVALGVFNTVGINLLNLTGGYPDGYNYRESVAVWFRSLFVLSPDPGDMVGAPLSFQLHAAVAMLLFALVPFTRLVHIFSAPVGYMSRPYLVYRSRDTTVTGNRDPQRGWEPIRRG